MIYTSSYWEVLNIEHNLKNPLFIQISTSCPPGFKVDGIWSEVVPSWYGMVQPHKLHKISDDEYLNRYRVQVKNTAETKLFNEIIEDLKQFYKGEDMRDAVLLCWCDKRKFCHRHWLREFLNTNYRLDIKEL